MLQVQVSWEPTNTPLVQTGPAGVVATVVVFVVVVVVVVGGKVSPSRVVRVVVDVVVVSGASVVSPG